MSRTTPSPAQLEAAAKALRLQETLKAWRRIDTTGSVISIDWSTGSSVEGYGHLNDMVIQKLDTMIHAIVQDCLDDHDRKVEALVKEIGL